MGLLGFTLVTHPTHVTSRCPPCLPKANHAVIGAWLKVKAISKRYPQLLARKLLVKAAGPVAPQPSGSCKRERDAWWQLVTRIAKSAGVPAEADSGTCRLSTMCVSFTRGLSPPLTHGGMAGLLHRGNTRIFGLTCKRSTQTGLMSNTEKNADNIKTLEKASVPICWVAAGHSKNKGDVDAIRNQGSTCFVFVPAFAFSCGSAFRNLSRTMRNMQVGHNGQ